MSIRETVEQKLKRLAELSAKAFHITPEELSVSLTFFPAENTWGISVTEFVMEDGSYITNEEYLVEYIANSVDEAFDECFEQLEKMTKSPPGDSSVVSVTKDSKLLN